MEMTVPGGPDVPSRNSVTPLGLAIGEGTGLVVASAGWAGGCAADGCAADGCAADGCAAATTGEYDASAG